MAARSFADKLRGYESAWNTGKNPMPELPAGTYEMQLEEAAFHESQTSGTLSLRRKHVVTSGEEQGKEITDYLSFASDAGIRGLAEWMQKFGYTPPDNIEEVEDIINLIADNCPLVEMRVAHGRNGGVFLNLIRVVEAQPGTMTSQPKPARKEPEPESLPESEPIEQNDDAFKVGDTVEFDAEVEGGVDTGKITAVHGDGNYDVETGNGEYEGLPGDLLRKVEVKPAAPKAKPEAKPAGKANGEDEKKRRSLLSVAGTFNISTSNDGRIKINDQTPLPELIKALDTYSWHEGADDNAVAITEAEILRSCGIPVEEPPAITPKRPTRKK